MINVKLNDGLVREIEEDSNIYELAKLLSKNLAKSAVVGEVNGTLVDLSYKLKNNDEVNILTFEDEKAVEVMRHSTSHVMAQAVKRVFKNLKLAIGPSRDNGFYYDFDLEEPLTIEDLNKTEKEVSNIYIKAFKLTSVAGAYWRGNEKNKMLQRVYGVAFASKEDLKTYLHNLEEVKKRDHRKLGKDLKLFTFVEEGPGFPIFLHKGVVLKNILINYWRDVHQKAGYVEIETPIMLNKKLWATSGY